MEEKSTRELLEEVLKYQKKEVRHARLGSLISLVLVVAIVAAGVLLVPRALSLISLLETSLTDINKIVSDAGALISSTNTVVSGNAEAITDAVTKLNNIDFDTLNQAIRDFQQAVEPLSKLGQLFGR